MPKMNVSPAESLCKLFDDRWQSVNFHRVVEIPDRNSSVEFGQAVEAPLEVSIGGEFETERPEIPKQLRAGGRLQPHFGRMPPEEHQAG